MTPPAGSAATWRLDPAFDPSSPHPWLQPPIAGLVDLYCDVAAAPVVDECREQHPGVEAWTRGSLRMGDDARSAELVFRTKVAITGSSAPDTLLSADCLAALASKVRACDGCSCTRAGPAPPTARDFGEPGAFRGGHPAHSCGPCRSAWSDQCGDALMCASRLQALLGVGKRLYEDQAQNLHDKCFSGHQLQVLAEAHRSCHHASFSLALPSSLDIS